MNSMFDHSWFTADQHFGHENILKYADRPYSNLKEMDADLIEKWNNKVSQFDAVYHLGDFTLGGITFAEHYFYKLNGTVHILNNFWHHDKRWIREYNQCITQSGSVVLLEPPIVVLVHHLQHPQLSELSESDYPLAITLCHYPIGEWDRKHHGAWHLHGHSHNKYHGEGKILDVGVDSAFSLLGEYRPFSFSEIIEIMDSK